MSIREFAQALRTTQGQHILASVLEGPEQGQRLLLCEGVPVWPPKPEGLLARNLPALAGCGASGLLTLEDVRVFVEKFGGTSRLVLCGGGHVAESVVRLAVMLGLPVTGLEERPDYADALRPRDHRFPPRLDPPGGGRKDADAAGWEVRRQRGRRHHGVPHPTACIKNAGRRGRTLSAGGVLGQRAGGRRGACSLRRFHEGIFAAAQGGKER